MAQAQRIQVVLEFDTGSTPISGRLRDAHGRDVEFSGWLGLAAALEEVLSAAIPIPLPPAPRSTSRP